MRPMRPKHLIPLAGLLVGSLALAPAPTEAPESDQGPIGVCAHVPRLHDEPICVLVYPNT